jgi:hypothetical protein
MPARQEQCSSRIVGTDAAIRGLMFGAANVSFSGRCGQNHENDRGCLRWLTTIALVGALPHQKCRS